MTDLPEIARHWSRQTDKAKGIRLDAAAMDMLNAIGVGELIREHAEFAANPRDFPSPPEGSTCRKCGQATASLCYFIQQGNDGPIKIGIATDIRKRLWSLQTSTPAPLNLLATIPGKRETETALHAFYASEHLRGEWFRPSLRLMAYIAELAQ